jgi:hypothetical protein
MGQESLVTEQIDAGVRFLSEFEKHMPVQAAFWLQADEDALWYLYVASDQINVQTLRAAYAEVIRLAGEMKDPNFDPFRVKLIRVDHPWAQSALEIYRRYPSRIPTHSQGQDFGGRSVAGVYIYPPPVASPVR